MRLHVWFLSLVIAGCASQSTNLNPTSVIHPGMDKDAVLDKAGSPRLTFRSGGKDHWQYSHYENHQEYRTQVDFADGKVIRVGRPVLKRDAKRLEDAETLEEFESQAKERRKRAGQFKDVDGEPTGK